MPSSPPLLTLNITARIRSTEQHKDKNKDRRKPNKTPKQEAQTRSPNKKPKQGAQTRRPHNKLPKADTKTPRGGWQKPLPSHGNLTFGGGLSGGKRGGGLDCVAFCFLQRRSNVKFPVKRGGGLRLKPLLWGTKSPAICLQEMPGLVSKGSMFNPYIGPEHPLAKPATTRFFVGLTLKMTTALRVREPLIHGSSISVGGTGSTKRHPLELPSKLPFTGKPPSNPPLNHFSTLRTPQKIA